MAKGAERPAGASGAATARRLRAQVSKEKIFGTAIKLIKKNGYDSTGISDICREAGISTGAFYHYFKSKQDILNELYIRGDLFFEQFMKARKKRQSTVDEAKDYMNAYICFITLEGLNGIDMCRNLYTPKNPLFAKTGRSMQTLLEGIIRRGQDRGEISRRFGSAKWVDFVFTVLRGIVFDWVLRDGSYDIKKSAKTHIECLGNFLKNAKNRTIL
jgi:AcrR family transcriptional regulator